MTWPKTATEMSRALRSKDVSSYELLSRTFAEIDAQESAVGAFITLADRTELTSQAKQIDADRAAGEELPEFAGVPIAVKDNIAVKGERLSCGSRMLENYVSPFDATVSKKLRAQRMLVIGKTNMDEFGFGSSTENSALQKTRNPRALDRVPGGTSGGSAAAVAAGYVPWALGTDTGGSVRQPAALCGVVGLRPSYGRVSRYGVVAYASSMDQVGPLSTSVEDSERLLSIIAGHDAFDSTSLPGALEDFDVPTGALRIGIPTEYLDERCQPEVLQGIEQASAWLSAEGHEVRPISLPSTNYALATYYILASVEAASNLARYDGIKYGYRAKEDVSVERMTAASRAEGFGPEAKRRIMLGTFASSAGYADKYYEQAARTRQMLREDFSRAFADVDVILAPVSPTTAWPLGARVSDPSLMYLMDIYTVPASLGGIPAVSVPIGTDDQGLPIGVQMYAPHQHDLRALRAARLLERSASQSDHG